MIFYIIINPKNGLYKFVNVTYYSIEEMEKIYKVYTSCGFSVEPFLR